MASSLNAIKNRIKLTKNIEKITNALKLTSSTKMKRLLRDFEKFQVYLKVVYDSLDLLNTVYKLPENKKTMIYIVTSNIGLCGAYNTRVYNCFLKEVENNKNFEVIHIGKKLEKKLSIFNYRHLDLPLGSIHSTSLLEAINYEVNNIQTSLKKNEISKIIVIGHEFVNQLIQNTQVFNILPFSCAKNKYLQITLDSIELLPSKQELLSYIIPFYLSVALRASIFESILSIEAMRNLAMDNATKNAKEFIDNLTLEYNRARQALITQEIIEIVSGANGG